MSQTQNLDTIVMPRLPAGAKAYRVQLDRCTTEFAWLAFSAVAAWSVWGGPKYIGVLHRRYHTASHAWVWTTANNVDTKGTRGEVLDVVADACINELHLQQLARAM